jgi:alkylation response protein AidB-like acyl-CoA dehydrogenase
MSNPPQDGSLKDQFEQATLELAIAQNALTDAADFVRSRAPASQGVGTDEAADDPHVILRFGQLRARLHAAEGLLARATRMANASELHEAAVARPSGAIPSASVGGTTEAAVLVALIEARAFTSDLGAEIASQLVAWGGPLRAGQQRRDASGQLTYTANHWNYHHAGNYYLKGVAPAPHKPEPRS